MYSHDTVHVRPPLSLPLNLLDLFYNITNEWYFKLGAVICYFFNCASWISKLPAWTRKMGIISSGTFATLNRRHSWILDYTPWISDSRYWIPVFVSGTLWILIVSGISDTLRCIPDSTSQDSGSDNKISSGFSIFELARKRIGIGNLKSLLVPLFNSVLTFLLEGDRTNQYRKPWEKISMSRIKTNIYNNLYNAELDRSQSIKKPPIIFR